MDFVQKLNFLLSLFFTEIMLEKILFGYFKSETLIKRPENEVQTISQIWTFFKRVVHGFCPKIELSLIAVFHRNYDRKDHFWIF